MVLFPLFPTVAHGLAVWAALGILFFSEHSLQHASTQRNALRLRLVLAGAATGVSAYYALWMLPGLPILVFSILYLVGLFGLAPYWSLLCAMAQSRAWFRHCRHHGFDNLNLAAWFVPAFLAAPTWFVADGYLESDTHREILRAGSEDPTTRIQARRALQDRFSPTDLVRVFRKQALQRGRRTGTRPWFFHRQKTLDSAVFEDVFGSRVEEWSVPFEHTLRSRGSAYPPTLVSSHLQVAVDDVSAIATVRWEMTLTNRSEFRDQEARMRLSIPPGSVAHDLELWIRDAWQPAAFAGVATVQNAYEEIALRRRKDPALLLEPFPGQLTLRVAPILANRVHRVRFSVTIPLLFDGNAKHSELRLPYIVIGNTTQRPFDIDHVVESVGPADSVPNIPRIGNEKLAALRLQIQTGAALSTTARAVDADGTTTQTIVPNTDLEQGSRTEAWAGGLVLAIGQSEAVHSEAVDWRGALRSLPASTPVTLVLGGATRAIQQGDAESLSKDSLDLPAPASGPIDGAALVGIAREVARDMPGNPLVVWVHGAHEFRLESEETLDEHSTPLVLFAAGPAAAGGSKQRVRPFERLAERGRARSFRRRSGHTATEDLIALFALPPAAWEYKDTGRRSWLQGTSRADVR